MNIHERSWPTEGLTRIPYWIYADRELYAEEQARIFRGDAWTFLCLEAELPTPNSFRLSNLGDMPVVVTRDKDGAIHAFENRCAHRGSLLCLKDRGEAREIVCVYHNWTYDLTGKLTGVAFRRDIAGKEYEQAGMRTAHDGYQLEAPELLENIDEFGDGVGLQILTVFPGFLLQQIRNALAVRRIVPRGLDQTELVWTCFGFTTDDEALAELRLRQANLIGPAGFISMEDGAAAGFVQRGVAGAGDAMSLVEMGGSGTASEESRVSEAAVRGFWKDYRHHMGF